MNPLERRRRKLGMSRSALAERSGVSLATVNRVLGGNLGNASFGNVTSIASALGMSLKWKAPTALRFKRLQAKKKAQKLASLVQGTSALEGQAVNARVKEEIADEIECQLLAGPKRKLWSA